MNRTVIIVKDPKPVAGRKFALISLHWQYGQIIENWLTASCPHWSAAWDLIEQGHRATIFEQYRLPKDGTDHDSFKTLKEAKEAWEHYTLAYYDGKEWKFEHSHT